MTSFNLNPVRKAYKTNPTRFEMRTTKVDRRTHPAPPFCLILRRLRHIRPCIQCMFNANLQTREEEEASYVSLRLTDGNKSKKSSIKYRTVSRYSELMKWKISRYLSLKDGIISSNGR